jgi:hypothetical protein
VVSVPVYASAVIYKGGLVMVNSSGYAIPGADTASCKCFGVAMEDKTGGTSSGDVDVKVGFGAEWKFAASSITQAMLETTQAMYIVDDNTIDDAAGATNDVFVGVLTEFVSTTSGWVFVTGPCTYPTTGVTSSVAQINKLDGVTDGEVTASKFIAAGADSGVANLGPVEVQSASATALTVGRLGSTTPAFTVDSSTGSQVAGLKVTGAATGGTVAVVATDSGADASVTINAKGAGTVAINGTATGAITLGAATGITGNATVTSAGAASLSVGRLGATTPAFCVDSSTGTQVAGLKVTGAATAGTVAVVATDSGADTNLSINAKGAGAVSIGITSNGGVLQRRPIHVAQATDTLTIAESGTTFICAVDAKLTLPSAVAGTEGVWYHIVTGVASAGAGVIIDPAAGDAICYVTSLNNKDLINTPGTDVEGDSVTIVSDGANQWWVESMIGIWAKEG